MSKETGFEYKQLLDDDTTVPIAKPGKFQRSKYFLFGNGFFNYRSFLFFGTTVSEICLISLIDSLQWMESIKHSEQSASISGFAFWLNIVVNMIWCLLVYLMIYDPPGSNRFSSCSGRFILRTLFVAQQLTLLQSYIWHVMMLDEVNCVSKAANATQVVLSILLVFLAIIDTNRTSVEEEEEPSSDCHDALEV